MKKTLSSLFKIVICLLLLTYAEKHFLEVLTFFDLNVSNFSTLTLEIFSVILYVLIFLIVYYIYKDDIQSDFTRYKRNLFPNFLMSIAFFLIVTVIVGASSYVIDVIANSFGVNYIGLTQLNIFERKFDLDLIFYSIKYILIVPFIKVMIYVLAVNNLIKSKNKGILLSGLFAAIIVGINMNESFLYILFNALPYFIFYSSLAYVYRKNNTNIWYSIITNLLYVSLASILLAKIL